LDIASQTAGFTLLHCYFKKQRDNLVFVDGIMETLIFTIKIAKFGLIFLFH